MAGRIYDCFLYNGEPILALRLKLLAPLVHRFVAVESALTFKGDPKAPRYDAARWQPLAAHAGQIDYRLLAPQAFSACRTAWDREALQRNALLQGLEEADDDDIALISDVDEIPHPQALGGFDGRPAWLRQWAMAYYGNLMCRTEPYWLKGTRMLRVGDLRRHSAEAVRLQFALCFPQGRMIDRGGWHFTYLGGVAAIRQKIGEFSHQELNTAELNAEASIRAQIESRLDIYYRPLAYAAIRPDSLGHAGVAAWLADEGLLVPGGDDNLSADQVMADHEALPRWQWRLQRLGLKWRQRWRRRRTAPPT